MPEFAAGQLQGADTASIKQAFNVAPVKPADPLDVGKIASTVARTGLTIEGERRKAELQGEASSVFADEASGDVTQQAEASEMAEALRTEDDPFARQELMKGMDDLTKISRMRKAGVISGAEAQMRANALIKQKMNSPLGHLFADKLKSAGQEFFAHPVGGNFFADPAGEKSPQQKAMEKVAQETYEFMYRTGLQDFDTAHRALSQQATRDFQIKQMEFTSKNRQLAGDEQAAYTELLAQQNTGNMFAQINRVAGADGIISPQERIVAKDQINQVALQMRQQLLQVSGAPDGEPNINSTAYKQGQERISTWVREMEAVLDDKNALKIVKENTDLTAAAMTADLDRNLPGFSVARVMGPEAQKVLIEVMGRGNNAYGAGVAAQNPFMAAMLQRAGFSPANARNNGLRAWFGQDKVDRSNAEDVGFVATDPKMPDAVNESLKEEPESFAPFMNALRIAPETLTAYDTKQWTRTFNSNPTIWKPKVEQMHRTSVANVMMNMMSALGEDLASAEDMIVQFGETPEREPQRGRRRGPRPEIMPNLVGTSLGKLGSDELEKVKAVAGSVLRQARKAPFIWQGEFSTPEEYANWRLRGGREEDKPSKQEGGSDE